ncbi:MAG: PD40 domain-containing protein [Candidatus Kapabacteria bacterium]|nr:PD40 domain-containing protein [Candidatus Kapabacteria bacterium]
MKTIHLLLVLALSVFIASCSDKVLTAPTVESSYAVYIKRTSQSTATSIFKVSTDGKGTPVELYSSSGALTISRVVSGAVLFTERTGTSGSYNSRIARLDIASKSVSVIKSFTETADEYQLFRYCQYSPNANAICYIRTRFTKTPRLESKVQLLVANADGTNERIVNDSVALEQRPVISPDGMKIAFFSGSADFRYNLFIADVSGQTNKTISGISYQTDDMSTIEWSSDSRTLLVGDKDNLKTVNVNTGIVSNIGTTVGVFHGIWSKNDATIYAMQTRNGDTTALSVLPLDGTDPTALSPQYPGRYVMRPRLSPDGTKIMYSTVGTLSSSEPNYADSKLYILDLTTKSVTPLLPQTNDYGYDAVWGQ